MKIILHQQDITIGDLTTPRNILKGLSKENSSVETIHLFPEIFLGGYPLQDLVLDKGFIASYQETLLELDQSFKSAKESNQAFIFGGLSYELNEKGLPVKIFNTAYLAEPSKGIKDIYHKKLLPNYDIFDEQKYFTPGTKNSFLEIFGKTFAIIICEDMWHSTQHQVDPVSEIHQQILSDNISLDGIFNISASPFAIEKQEKRKIRVKEISQLLGAPFYYANSLGLQDEILFDGRSLSYNGKDFNEAGLFFPETLEVNHEYFGDPKLAKNSLTEKNTWEDLFSPRICRESKKLLPLSNSSMEEVISAQLLGISSYAKKTGLTKITIALSGGIDSALVLALAWMANKQYALGGVEAIYMPGQYSSSLSYDLSKKMCEQLKIPFFNFPIKFLHQNLRHSFRENIHQELEGLADENIQSRMRGSILYARSNQQNSLVLNTSNKSELAVGYSTLYGDSVGAISPLGDLFKSEVFQISNFINQSLKTNIIPKEIIERPPTAELRENQKDEDSLPPYERLDFYLEALLSHQVTRDELFQLGFDQEEITRTFQLLKNSEYKRFQFCPIIKVKNKSFGFGRRMPILKI